MDSSQIKKPLEVVKEKFHSKLIDLLKESTETIKSEPGSVSATKKSSLLNNVWLLNQTFSQLVTTTNSTFQCGHAKIRFSLPELTSANYVQISKSPNHFLDQVNNATESANFSIPVDSTKIQPKPSLKFTQSNKKQYFSCLYACNYQSAVSVPLITYPRSDLDTSLSEPLQRVNLIQETQLGDLNDLALFNKWLRKFQQQQKEINSEFGEKPTILLGNTLLYSSLIRSCQDKASLDDLLNFCALNKVHILFYPVEASVDPLQKIIASKLKENFKKYFAVLAAKENPNSMTNFVYVMKQCMRVSAGEARNAFKELINLYPLPYENLTSLILKSDANENICESNDEVFDDEEGKNHNNHHQTSQQNKFIQNNNNNNSNNIVHYPKISDEEAIELSDWVNRMSHVGCLCIRYTYLRELYLRHKPTGLKMPNRDVLASEKRWLDLMKKVNPKLNPDACTALNENLFHLKWFNSDFWRMSYFNYVKKECVIESSDSLWTFDMFEFPYSTVNNQLRAPEKDNQRRPRNTKAKVSVIFAFNAAGDYLQPFFVYPTNFNNESPAQSELNTNEHFSHNGYVTCRVFEQWLQTSFLPYLKNKQAPSKNILLLYCAKLAVVDARNLKICAENDTAKVNLFCLTLDNQMPFNLTFQKNLRKRQIDLFLDSWRKVTSKQNLSYQFKCKSRQEFFNLFMDAFQNCIEEIGTSNSPKSTDVSGSKRISIESPLNLSTSSGVVEFRNKMSSAFEMCQLWPVNEEDYKVFIEKGTKFVEESMAKGAEADENDKELTEEDAERDDDEEDESEDEESQLQENIGSADCEEEELDEESGSEYESTEPNTKRRRITSSTHHVPAVGKYLNGSGANNNSSTTTKRGRRSKSRPMQIDSQTPSASSSNTTLADVINKDAKKVAKSAKKKNDENLAKGVGEEKRGRKKKTAEIPASKDLVIDLLALLIEENKEVTKIKSEAEAASGSNDLKQKFELVANESTSKEGFLKKLFGDLSTNEARMNGEEKNKFLKSLADLLCEAYADKKFLQHKENSQESMMNTSS